MKAGMHLARVVYSTDRSAIEDIIPPGFSAEEGVEPTIMFEVSLGRDKFLHQVKNLSNLPWLAGRGYNTESTSTTLFTTNLRLEDPCFRSFLNPSQTL